LRLRGLPGTGRLEKALADLQVSEAAQRQRRLTELNQTVIEQTQQLLDQLAAERSFGENSTLYNARQALVEMHNLFTQVSAKAAVRQAVDDGLSGLSRLSDTKWDDPQMRAAAIAFLTALRCQFGRHTF
jgi:hypothetical protein